MKFKLFRAFVLAIILRNANGSNNEIKQCIDKRSQDFSQMAKTKYIQIDGDRRLETDFAKIHVSTIVSLNISFSNIKIPFRDSNFENLLLLHASHNGLLSFEDIGRETFPSLRLLNVSFNAISSLKSDLFDHMKELEIIDLSNNCLSHFFFGMELTKHENIKKLYLQHNLLKTFSAGFNVAIKHLSILDLSFNQLQSFKSHEHMYDELFLNDNRLKLVEYHQRNGPKQILHAQNNLASSFESTVEFSMLNLSNNKFENLFEFSIGSASALDLSHNKINLMPESSASVYSDFDYDYAVDHSMSSYPTQIHVKILDLSYNKIKAINNIPELKRFKGLHNLNLEGNLITDLDNDKFENEYSSLKHVNLKKNPLLDHKRKQLNFHSYFQIKYELDTDEVTTTSAPENLIANSTPHSISHVSPLKILEMLLSTTTTPDYTTPESTTETIETTEVITTTIPLTTPDIAPKFLVITEIPEPQNEPIISSPTKPTPHTSFLWILISLFVLTSVMVGYFVLNRKHRAREEGQRRLVEFENIL